MNGIIGEWTGVNHGCCNMKIHVRLRYVFSFGEKVSGVRSGDS